MIDTMLLCLSKYRSALLLCLTLSISSIATSGLSQEEETGRSLMERGLELFLKGLQDEIEPGLNEAQRLFDEISPTLRGFLSEMGPALGEIAREIEDWSLYELPEILPNGDILIRRKSPENERAQPEGSSPSAPPDSSIEL